jgi:hypothetical protein
MCRSIKKLRRPDAMPTDQELHEAALQFVRKISGMRRPSQSNEQAFDAAVRDVAVAGRALFNALYVPRPGTPVSRLRLKAPDGVGGGVSMRGEQPR